VEYAAWGMCLFRPGAFVVRYWEYLVTDHKRSFGVYLDDRGVGVGFTWELEYWPPYHGGIDMHK